MARVPAGTAELHEGERRVVTGGPAPGSAPHRQLITASKVAAIVGLSSYQSAWELWHVMKGLAPDQPQNDGMSRGHYLEGGVLAWWRDQHPDATVTAVQPWYTIGDWGGARPDMYCDDDGHGNPAVVEAKTDAGDGFGTAGTDEIPPGYLCQVQWQMACSGAQVAYVPMLGQRLAFAEYVVPRDDDVIGWLIDEATAFRESLAGDVPPAVDGSRATIACLKRMHRDVEPGVRAVLTGDQFAAYAEARAVFDAALARRDAAEAVVRDVMGCAQYAVVDGVPVVRRQPSGRGVAFKLI